MQGKVAPKATLLLYIYLVEVPPDEQHTVVVNAKGAPIPEICHHSGAAASDRSGLKRAPPPPFRFATGLEADTDYFIRLKGVAGGGEVKASGAALTSGRFKLQIPAPAMQLNSQGG